VYRRRVSNTTGPACLTIADVSGYTGYLAGVELDHAQDILADLISTIVEAMAPFRLSKLEGDAALAYLPGAEIDGSMLQDTIEGTYVAFRSRLRNIQQASTCECNACTRIPTLDLKFVVHHGLVARQQMLGTEELVGTDVILAHRLLKNAVTDATGIAAYALYTDATLAAASIDPIQQGLVQHEEETDVAGGVSCWVRDLEAHWRAEQARPRREIPPDLLLREFTWEVPTPPAVTWEWLTSPVLRPRWDTTITQFDEETEDGRRGVGTTNHCLHGEDAVREDILDWRPPHYWMMQGNATFLPGEPGIYLSDELEALPDGGTRVLSRVGKLEEYAIDLDQFESLEAALSEQGQIAIQRLREMLRTVAETLPAADVEVPASAGRFLNEPISG
jgi:hypothetical protein